uniref:Uncharacterized protein n=1 Tax=Gasterosteus aculeatus TaxID=69293 RepID=G3PTI3_GASAC
MLPSSTAEEKVRTFLLLNAVIRELILIWTQRKEAPPRRNLTPAGPQGRLIQNPTQGRQQRGELTLPKPQRHRQRRTAVRRSLLVKDNPIQIRVHQNTGLPTRDLQLKPRCLPVGQQPQNPSRDTGQTPTPPRSKRAATTRVRA